MVDKRDYNNLVNRIEKLMLQLEAKQDKDRAYHFDTVCGKMRILYWQNRGLIILESLST